MRPKGSAEALEARRMIGGTLLQQGKGIREVARLLGVTPTSVIRWKEALKEGGLEALKAKPHPGRPPALSVEQKEALVSILRQGPLAAGFATDLWTLERVAQVIKTHFAIEYHPGHVWYLLRGLGWSPQKPDRRARERDEDAITAWRDETWPQVKKSLRPRLEHRADRRERLYAAAGRAPHLGAARPDADSVQLGPPGSLVGDFGDHDCTAASAAGFVLSDP